MKIIILTQYFPPETGAPQNRLWALAKHLHAMEGVRVQVLTAMPNYPAMRVHERYRRRFTLEEEMEGIPVTRAWIWASRKGGVIRRLLNYFSFVISSVMVGSARLPRADFLICESPPLFLGISAWVLARSKKAGLVFNVSDLWPESAEKMGVITNPLLLKPAYRLEAMIYRRSVLVSCQTRGIEDNVRQRFPSTNTCWLPNGAELDRFVPGSFGSAWREKEGFSSSDTLFLYAGIIGHAQGLDVILDAAKLLAADSSLHFILLGEGPERERLKHRIAEEEIRNVHSLDPVQKETMPEVLDAIDAAVIPLRRLELFRGAIPSKIFEALAMEKPVLLGVEGEAHALFVGEAGAALPFIPEDAASLAANAMRLAENTGLRAAMGQKGRAFVSAHFDRRAISAGFFRTLESLAAKQTGN